MNKVLPLVFLAIAFFGGKTFFEYQASRMVDTAVEMSEDGQHDEALDEIRMFETWFAWTPSAERAEEVKDEIRRRQRSASQEAVAQRKFNQLNRELEEERKAEEAHQRRMEEIDKRLEGDKLRIKEESRRKRRSRGSDF